MTWNDFIRQNSILSPELRIKLWLTGSGFVILWLLCHLVRLVVFRLVGDVKIRYRLNKTFSYLATFLGMLLFGLVWIEGLKSIMTFLGLFSAGLAFALRDPVMNAFGSLFIVWRRPFDVGDRIEIGGHIGDVIDTRIFHFTMLEVGKWVDQEQSTGRIIHIPNGKVFTEPLANYSKGFQFIWNELAVPLTYDSDWRKAKALLLQIACRHTEHLSEEATRRVREASQRYMIFYSNLTPTVYTTVRSEGIVLTVRYLCRHYRRRDSAQAIWEDILAEFAGRPDIRLTHAAGREIFPSPDTAAGESELAAEDSEYK